MKTFVKIEGANIEPVVQKLAKLAVDLPEVCVWDVNMMRDSWSPGTTGSYSDAPAMAEMGAYLGMRGDEFAKRCDKIISRSGDDLGDAVIYYEWAEKPTKEQLSKLEKRIEDIVKPTRMKYTITSR